VTGLEVLESILIENSNLQIKAEPREKCGIARLGPGTCPVECETGI
jgi:hypothetical protein